MQLPIGKPRVFAMFFPVGFLAGYSHRTLALQVGVLLTVLLACEQEIVWSVAAHGRVEAANIDSWVLWGINLFLTSRLAVRGGAIAEGRRRFDSRAAIISQVAWMIVTAFALVAVGSITTAGTAGG